MGMFEFKQPILIDLDKGIIGTFIKNVSDEGTEDGYVYPVFAPLNDFFPKKIRYSEPVAITHMFEVSPPRTNIPGVEPKIMFIYRGLSKDSIMKVLDEKNVRIIKELIQKNRDLQLEIATARQDTDVAIGGVSKQIERQKSVGRRENNGNNPLNPFGGGGGGNTYDNF